MKKEGAGVKITGADPADCESEYSYWSGLFHLEKLGIGGANSDLIPPFHCYDNKILFFFKIEPFTETYSVKLFTA